MPQVAGFDGNQGQGQNGAAAAGLASPGAQRYSGVGELSVSPLQSFVTVCSRWQFVPSVLARDMARRIAHFLAAQHCCSNSNTLMHVATRL